jgi:ATP-dependent Clp protease ATP-binding subunit ClpA
VWAEVTAEDIAEVVSRATGIPVSQLTQEERERLMRLEEQLHERVVGQDEAVTAVAEAIRRARAGLSDPNRPIGSFLFLGPTGVGKTELARTLAEALFGDEAAMVRIDMSEFQERHTVRRLVGAPPGYVGYEEVGQLTESIRRRPYSVLLDRTTRRLRAQGIEVEFTEGAVGLIGEEGFDPEFGARPLRRTIQRRVDNELASMVLSGSLEPGDRVIVGADGEAGGLTFEVVAGAAAAEPPGDGG